MLASETGTRGQRGEDEGMVGDVGACGKLLAAVDKCSGPSAGWRAGGGCAICHDPHSHSLMAVNSGVHWKPSWGGSSGQGGTPRICTPRPGLGRGSGEEGDSLVMICTNGKRPPDGEIPHPSRGPLHRLGWALPPDCGAGLPGMTLWERMGLYTLGKFLLAQCEPQWEVKLCVCIC